MPPDSAGPASTTSVAYWENRDSCLLILGHFFHAPGKCFSLQHLVHSATSNVLSQFSYGKAESCFQNGVLYDYFLRLSRLSDL